MRGCNRQLCFSVKESGNVWKGYVDRIISEDNYLDHNVEGNAVEGPVDCVGGDEVIQALTEMKIPWIFRCIIAVDCCYRVSRNSSDS